MSSGSVSHHEPGCDGLQAGQNAAAEDSEQHSSESDLTPSGRFQQQQVDILQALPCWYCRAYQSPPKQSSKVRLLFSVPGIHMLFPAHGSWLRQYCSRGWLAGMAGHRDPGKAFPYHTL